MTQHLKFIVLAAGLAFAACAEVQRFPDEPRFSAPQSERSATPKPVTEQHVGIAVRQVAPPPPPPVTQAASPATGAVLPAFAQAVSATAVATAAAAVTTAPAAVTTAVTTTTSAVTVATQPMRAPVTATALARPKILEARLSGVPVCDDMLVERMDGVQPVRQVLGQEDEILMWSAYGGAGLVAVLTTIGMARGQDAGRGVLLFGIYGLPLAGVGAFETWRMRTLDEPIAPRYSRARPVGELACPKGSDSLPVRVVLAPGDVTEFALAPTWTPVPGGERLAVSYDAETEAPTLLRDGRLTAFLGVPRPKDEAPAPVTTIAPAAVSAPVAAAPVTAAATPPCAAVATKTRGSGWLPKAFFAQPVKAAQLRDGVSLEEFAAAELGGKQYLWQVEELNADLKKALQGPRPIKLKVPVQVKSASDWKSLLPPTCE